MFYFTLASLLRGHFCLKQLNPSSSLVTVFTNILINPSLMWSGGKYIFVWSNKFDVLSSSDLESFLLGVAIGSLGWPVHIGCNKISYNLLAAQSALPHLSGQLICSTGGLRNLFFSANLKCWRRFLLSKLHEQEVFKKCLFPLCSQTAFNITLDESMNSLHCSGAYCSSTSSINPQASLHYTRSPSIEK
jgi:hypothetical protein